MIFIPQISYSLTKLLYILIIVYDKYTHDNFNYQVSDQNLLADI